MFSTGMSLPLEIPSSPHFARSVLEVDDGPEQRVEFRTQVLTDFALLGRSGARPKVGES